MLEGPKSAAKGSADDHRTGGLDSHFSNRIFGLLIHINIGDVWILVKIVHGNRLTTTGSQIEMEVFPAASRCVASRRAVIETLNYIMKCKI